MLHEGQVHPGIIYVLLCSSSLIRMYIYMSQGGSLGGGYRRQGPTSSALALHHALDSVASYMIVVVD